MWQHWMHRFAHHLTHKEYKTIIFDNLVYGHKEAVKWGEFVQGDLKNINDIEGVFQAYPIEAVFHFAAYAYVGESVKEPEKYYYNNIVNTLNLLHVMKEYSCKKLFSPPAVRLMACRRRSLSPRICRRIQSILMGLQNLL